MTKQQDYSCYQSKTRILQWSRQKDELDSYDGYRFYDIDMVIWNANTNKWIVVEEKCRNQKQRAHQALTYIETGRGYMLNPNVNFQGTYLIQLDGEDVKTSVLNVTKYNYDAEQWEHEIEMDETSLVNWIKEKIG